MNSGRELDALVAETVMGWKTARQAACSCYKNACPEHGTFPHYSTDIAVAWEIFPKLCEKSTGCSFSVEYVLIPFLMQGWEATVNHDDLPERVKATADTAPHAICLAALRAKGVEV